MQESELKLSQSPLVETWLSLDFKGEKRLSCNDYTSLVDKEFVEAKVVRLLAERTSSIRQEGTLRTETITEDSAAGVVVDTKEALSMQIVLKNNRIECKILGKYPEWSVFISQAKNVVERCLKYFGSVEIQKISIRSVNKIFFPSGVSKFSDVLRMLPLDADGLQGVCADMLYRDTQYYLAYDAFATIARAYQRAPEAAKRQTPIYLDIDVFKMMRVDKRIELTDDILESLHQLKNSLFIGAITSAQLELYK